MYQVNSKRLKDSDSLSSHLLSRMRFLHGAGGALLFTLSGGALAACGGGASGGPATIKLGGYTGWIGAHEFENFAKQHPGSRVEEVVLNVDEERMAKLATDPSAVDIMLIAENYVERAIALDVVEKIDLAKVPNYKNVDESFKFGYAAPDKAMAVALDYGRTGFGYRKDLVKEKLTSWADVWKVAPKYSGKITLLDFLGNTIPSTLKMLGYPGSSRVETQIEEAGRKLIELKPHLQSFTQTDMTKGLLNGSVVIAMDWDYDMFNAMRQNPNIEWVDPEDGMVAYLDTWIAINRSKHLGVVHDFMNFHYEPKNYADFVNTTGTASCVPASRQFVDPALANSPVMYPGPDVLKRVEFQKPLGEATAIYEKVWAEVKAA